MNTSLSFILILALLSWTCAGQESQTKDARKAEAGKVTAHSGGLHGYIGFSATRPPARSEYSVGMGFYSAVWPLIDQPLANFQIGLAGSWITPDNSDNKDKPLAKGQDPPVHYRPEDSQPGSSAWEAETTGGAVKAESLGDRPNPQPMWPSPSCAWAPKRDASRLGPLDDATHHTQEGVDL